MSMYNIEMLSIVFELRGLDIGGSCWVFLLMLLV